MKIEQLEKGDLRYKEGMRYKINFNGFIMHFTEKALAELGRKIEMLQNTTSNSEYKQCEHLRVAEQIKTNCFPYGDDIKIKICLDCGKRL